MLLRESRVATSVNMRPFDLKGYKLLRREKKMKKIKKNMGQKNGNGKNGCKIELNGCFDFFFPMKEKKGKKEGKKGVAVC